MTGSIAVKKLVQVFTQSKANFFENVLEPFYRLLRLIPTLGKHLSADQTFMKCLLDRLNCPKAIVRINLLRILQAVCDRHPDRKQLEEKYSLGDVIKSLKANDKAVLVREIAKDLLQKQ